MPATELSTLMAWLNDPTKEIVARLAKNIIPQDIDALGLAMLTECDFAGYAPIRISDWVGVDYEMDDYAEAISGVLEWVAADGPVTEQNICVAYLTVVEAAYPIWLWWAIPLPRPFLLSPLSRTFTFEFRVESANLDGLSEVLTGV